MLWRHEAVLPWESSVGLEGSGKVLPWDWLWLAQAYFTRTWLRILQICGMFTPPRTHPVGTQEPTGPLILPSMILDLI